VAHARTTLCTLHTTYHVLHCQFHNIIIGESLLERSAKQSAYAYTKRIPYSRRGAAPPHASNASRLAACRLQQPDRYNSRNSRGTRGVCRRQQRGRRTRWFFVCICVPFFVCAYIYGIYMLHHPTCQFKIHATYMAYILNCMCA